MTEPRAPDTTGQEPPPLDLAELRATALESKKRAEDSSDDCLCHLEIAGLANDVLALLDRLSQAESALAAAEMHRAHALAVADRMDLDDMTVYAYMIRRALGVEAKEPTGET